MDAELLIPLMGTSMDSSQGGHYGWAPEKQDFNFPRCMCVCVKVVGHPHACRVASQLGAGPRDSCKSCCG